MSANSKAKLNQLLLELNSTAIHGSFCLNNEKVVMKDNLEIENLDKNELEATLSWIFAIVANNVEKIAEIVG